MRMVIEGGKHANRPVPESGTTATVIRAAPPAMERLEAGDAVDLPGLALDLGYADQAHLNRDFKALLGRTPAAYARSAHS